MAKQACDFAEGMSVDMFLGDPLTQQACCMNLIIIGEASRKILNEWPAFATHHASVGWHRMTGMRNRVAHGYEEIDFEIVWNTVKQELPRLIERLDSLLVLKEELPPPPPHSAP